LFGYGAVWTEDLEVSRGTTREFSRGEEGKSCGNFVYLVSLELIDSNTASFLFTVSVRDVSLGISAYRLYDCGASDSFELEKFLGSC
jgi:hypothetical protein